MMKLEADSKTEMENTNPFSSNIGGDFLSSMGLHGLVNMLSQQIPNNDRGNESFRPLLSSNDILSKLMQELQPKSLGQTRNFEGKRNGLDQCERDESDLMAGATDLNALKLAAKVHSLENVSIGKPKADVKRKSTYNSSSNEKGVMHQSSLKHDYNILEDPNSLHKFPPEGFQNQTSTQNSQQSSYLYTGNSGNGPLHVDFQPPSSFLSPSSDGGYSPTSTTSAPMSTPKGSESKSSEPQTKSQKRKTTLEGKPSKTNSKQERTGTKGRKRSKSTTSKKESEESFESHASARPTVESVQLGAPQENRENSGLVGLSSQGSDESLPGADNDHFDLSRRERKNNREKQRRSEVNLMFDKLNQSLDIPSNVRLRMDKISLLSTAIGTIDNLKHQVEQLQNEISSLRSQLMQQRSHK